MPHDGTPATAAANHPAFQLAARAGAEVIVLHIAAGEAARPPVERGTFGAPRYLDQPQHEWPAWAAEFIDRLCCLGDAPPALRMRLFVAAGEPGSEIIRAAREHGADLIVLAWRGRFATQRAATLERVIHHAPCPVLILRAEEGEGSQSAAT